MNFQESKNPQLDNQKIIHDLLNIIPSLETALNGLISEDQKWRENGKKLCRVGIDRLRALVVQLDQSDDRRAD